MQAGVATGADAAEALAGPGPETVAGAAEAGAKHNLPAAAAASSLENGFPWLAGAGT
jgi:hypothetical protein